MAETVGYNHLDAMGVMVREPRIFKSGSGCSFTLKCDKEYLDFKAFGSVGKICASIRQGEMVTIVDAKLKSSKYTDREGNQKWVKDLVVEKVKVDRSADFAEYGPAVPTPQVKTEEPMPDDHLAVADDIPF